MAYAPISRFCRLSTLLHFVRNHSDPCKHRIQVTCPKVPSCFGPVTTPFNSTALLYAKNTVACVIDLDFLLMNISRPLILKLNFSLFAVRNTQPCIYSNRSQSFYPVPLYSSSFDSYRTIHTVTFSSYITITGSALHLQQLIHVIRNLCVRQIRMDRCTA